MAHSVRQRDVIIEKEKNTGSFSAPAEHKPSKQKSNLSVCVFPQKGNFRHPKMGSTTKGGHASYKYLDVSLGCFERYI